MVFNVRTMENEGIKISIRDGTYFSNLEIDPDNKNHIYGLIKDFVNIYIRTREDDNYQAQKLDCYIKYKELREACILHYKKMYLMFKDYTDHDFNINRAYNRYIIRKDDKKNYDFDTKKLTNLGNYYIFGDTHGDFFPLISALNEDLIQRPPQNSSLPLPPQNSSLPLPPQNSSLPLPPQKSLLPLPPQKSLLPLPPQKSSLPLPPQKSSLPLPPQKSSLPLPPQKSSLPFPVQMVGGLTIQEENVEKKQTIIFLGDVFDPFNGNFVTDVYMYGNYNDHYFIDSKIAFAQYNTVVFFYYIIYLLYVRKFKIYWILGNHDLSYGFLYFYFFYLFYLGSRQECDLTFYFNAQITIKEKSQDTTYFLSHNNLNNSIIKYITNRNLYEKIYHVMLNQRENRDIRIKKNNSNKYDINCVLDLAGVTNYNHAKTIDDKIKISNYISFNRSNDLSSSLKLDHRNDFYVLFYDEEKQEECNAENNYCDFQNLNLRISSDYNFIYGHINHLKFFGFNEGIVYIKKTPLPFNYDKISTIDENIDYSIISYFSINLDSNLSIYQLAKFKRVFPICCQYTCNKKNALYNKVSFMKYENLPCREIENNEEAKKEGPEFYGNNNIDYTNGFNDYYEGKPQKINQSEFYNRGYKHGEQLRDIGMLDDKSKVTYCNRYNDICVPNNKLAHVVFKDEKIGEDMKIVGYMVYIKNDKYKFKNLIKDYRIHRFILTYDIYQNERLEGKYNYIKNARVFGGVSVKNSDFKYKGHKNRNKPYKSSAKPNTGPQYEKYNLRTNTYSGMIKTKSMLMDDEDKEKLKKTDKEEIKKLTSISEILTSAENITWNFVLIINNLCLTEDEKQKFSPFTYNSDTNPDSDYNIYYPLQTLDMETISHNLRNEFKLKYENEWMKEILLNFVEFVNKKETSEMIVETNEKKDIDIEKFYDTMLNYVKKFLERIKENNDIDIYLKFNIKLQYYFYLYKIYFYINRGNLLYTEDIQRATYYNKTFILSLLLYCVYENYLFPLSLSHKDKYNSLLNKLVPTIRELYVFFSENESKRYLKNLI